MKRRRIWRCERLTFQVDKTLPLYNGNAINAVSWWAEVFVSEKYPALSKMIMACLFIFHGPEVESSFNVMSDIVHAKSSRMNIGTYSAMQSVKYGLKAKNATAMDLYGRKDVVFDPVDRKLTSRMLSAAGRYKKVKEKGTLLQKEKMAKYGMQKPASKQAQKESRS